MARTPRVTFGELIAIANERQKHEASFADRWFVLDRNERTLDSMHEEEQSAQKRADELENAVVKSFCVAGHSESARWVDPVTGDPTFEKMTITGDNVGTPEQPYVRWTVKVTLDEGDGAIEGSFDDAQWVIGMWDPTTQ